MDAWFLLVRLALCYPVYSETNDGNTSRSWLVRSHGCLAEQRRRTAGSRWIWEFWELVTYWRWWWVGDWAEVEIRPIYADFVVCIAKL